MNKFNDVDADEPPAGEKRSIGSTAADGPKSKRTWLRHYDVMSAQVINPMGRSGISEGSSKIIWDLCSKSNAGCVYHSELCDKEPLP